MKKIHSPIIISKFSRGTFKGKKVVYLE